MGQGQMEIALNLLKKCSSEGSWLCLKNLHLVTAWLTTLEKVRRILFVVLRWIFLRSLSGTECSETSQRFSSLVDLRSASEVSNNSSPIKHQNHLRSSARFKEKSSSNIWNVDARWIRQRQCRKISDALRSRLVSRHYPRTTQIHSTGKLRCFWKKEQSNERGSFRVGRSFTNSLRPTFALVMKLFIDCVNVQPDRVSPSGQIFVENLNEYALAGGEIQWNFIHGLFDQAVYGGRVDNPVDTDVLRSYLNQYFNSAIVGGTRGLKSRLAPNINLPNSTELHVRASQICLVSSSSAFLSFFRIIKRFAMNFLRSRKRQVCLVFQQISKGQPKGWTAHR